MKVNFDAGDLTGDAGILLYQEFSDVIRLHKIVEQMVHIKDGVSHRDHVNHDVIMQKIFQNATGYMQAIM
ncbi:transposase [Virgibacillus sp. NKC19-16]|uniref:transposase n=1 Tax=Virgibacillus salidurans TaxID=2831673 RepID=UPI002104B630|nr:transposase [Virgibacillus sp. NKC19-16]UJL47413.1 transposase [Virgibacillus sp. NKC19-16]